MVLSLSFNKKSVSFSVVYRNRQRPCAAALFSLVFDVDAASASTARSTFPFSASPARAPLRERSTSSNRTRFGDDDDAVDADAIVRTRRRARRARTSTAREDVDREDVDRADSDRADIDRDAERGATRATQSRATRDVTEMPRLGGHSARRRRAYGGVERSLEGAGTNAPRACDAWTATEDGKSDDGRAESDASSPRSIHRARDNERRRIVIERTERGEASIGMPRALVIVYGLSADPPTDRGGHGSVVRALRSWRSDAEGSRSGSKSESARGRRADEILVVPTYSHAYASKRARQEGRNGADYDNRVAMCAIGFEDARLESEKAPFGAEGDEGSANSTIVTISRAERRAASIYGETASPSGKARLGSTVSLMDMLKRERPDTDFILCVGEDAFDDMVSGKWFRGDDLLKEYEVIVAPRHGYESTRREGDVAPAKKTLSVDIRGVSWLDSAATAPESEPVSSTKIRHALHRRERNRGERMNEDLGLPQGALHPDVLKYIIDQELYHGDVEGDDELYGGGTEDEQFDDPSIEKPNGYFASLSRRFANVSIEPSAYFSRDKSFNDKEDKHGLLAESRPLIGKEVEVHEIIKTMATREEFIAFKAMPYELFDRCIRTELQNNPPGKTWSQKRAEKYATSTVERARLVTAWRTENNVDELLEHSILPESDCMYTNWPAYVHGQDFYGHPIVCEWPAHVSPEGLKSRMTVAEILRHRIQVMETLEYMKSRSQCAHRVYKHVCFIDLDGVTLSYFTGEVKKFMTELVKLLTHRYTDSLHLMYLVNTPVIFRVIWSVLAPLLSTTTKSKIFMFGVGPNQSRKLAKQLAKHGIPNSVAPRCAGGASEGVRMDAYIKDAIELRKRLVVAVK